MRYLNTKICIEKTAEIECRTFFLITIAFVCYFDQNKCVIYQICTKYVNTLCYNSLIWFLSTLRYVIYYWKKNMFCREEEELLILILIRNLFLKVCWQFVSLIFYGVSCSVSNSLIFWYYFLLLSELIWNKYYLTWFLFRFRNCLLLYAGNFIKDTKCHGRRNSTKL